MRLGLLLPAIGQAHGIAGEYHGMDPSSPEAQLGATAYEEKVVDFLFSKAEITDRAVTREELVQAVNSAG
ncbi:hypothetical protein [Vitiosangium sp. GDMCC 1.1324]|uniref:hypothetical protein n=1 Tax=Vitiosangium sp. (strain GDMCC 1.1324) TaxID=2138576 RepID=UPI001E45D6ED|nr:hypothetical protein [Vitiosangium sp. GDMCC 1.1324]